jgi:hypothetical protein
MLTKILIGAVLATFAMSVAADGQPLPAATQQTATIKRTALQKFDVPGTNYETVIGIAEISPTSTSVVIPIPVLNRVTCWKARGCF